MNDTDESPNSVGPTGIECLKTQDDQEVVQFRGSSEDGKFELCDSSSCSWARAGTSFGVGELRRRIEPWLTALVQSEHVTLLVGSGLTHAVHYLATGKPLPGMSAANFGAESDLVTCAARSSALAADRGEGNIEDQIRVANEMLRGMELLGLEPQRVRALKQAIEDVLAKFVGSILAGERDLLVVKDTEPKARAFFYLVSFLMTFASRTGTRERLHLFTTNYDRYLEAGADLAGIRLIDRFVGMLSPVFRSSRLDIDLHYNPPGIRGEPRFLEGVVRFTKLHGSIDWVEVDRVIRRIALPFGVDEIAPYLKGHRESEQGPPQQIMVYPNAAKDRETAGYPYVELFRDFASAVCRPNSTVFTYGYSFGDDHINRVIEDMLTIPSTHLAIISRDDRLGRVRSMCDRHPAQSSLLMGDHLGDLRHLVQHYLPTPAIDRTTIRMAELLKARWTSPSDGGPTTAAGPAAEGTP